jgi:hypothetical protein
LVTNQAAMAAYRDLHSSMSASRCMVKTAAYAHSESMAARMPDA